MKTSVIHEVKIFFCKPKERNADFIVHLPERWAVAVIVIVIGTEIVTVIVIVIITQ
jgi:hypothetical protein